MIHTVELSKQVDHDTFCQLKELYMLNPVKPYKDSVQTKYFYNGHANNGIKLTLYEYRYRSIENKHTQTYYFIFVILNLAKLINHGNLNSRITLYQISDFDVIRDAFQSAMSEITYDDANLQALCMIDSYTTRRVDYCCQFKVKNPALYIHLLNRGRCPSRGMCQQMDYKDSCYIVGGQVEDRRIIKRGSITINIYDKHAEMSSEKNKGKYTEDELREAEGVLRVEIQAFRRKLIGLKDKYHYPDRNLKHYLDRGLAEKLLLGYVEEIAGTADYYRTPEKAVDKQEGIHKKTKEKIKEVLSLVNGNSKKIRSFWRLLETIKDNNEKESVKDVWKRMNDRIRVNPIAIPYKLDKESVNETHLLSVYSLIKTYFADSSSVVPSDDCCEEYLLEEELNDNDIEPTDRGS